MLFFLDISHFINLSSDTQVQQSALWTAPEQPSFLSLFLVFPGRWALKTITKKELANAVVENVDVQNNLASQAVDCLFQTMRDHLIDGDRIEIRGFGVWEVKDTKPKPAARNPRTGEIVYVPARRKTHFKPGKLLREALHKPRE